MQNYEFAPSMISLLQYSDEQVNELNPKLDDYIKQADELINNCTQFLSQANQTTEAAEVVQKTLTIPLDQNILFYKAKFAFKQLKRKLLFKDQKPIKISQGLSSITGKRPVNEDAHVMVQLSPQLYAYAIFDGHAGNAASQFCSENFKQIFQNQFDQQQNIVTALTSTFIELDKQFNEQSGMSGCTATVCILDVLNRDIICANAGDSRQIDIIMDKLDKKVEQDKKDVKQIEIEDDIETEQDSKVEEQQPEEKDQLQVKQLTIDHKPSVETEAARIVSYGSYVQTILGIPRVAGQLAVSRAIGDVSYKQFGIIAVPEVFEYENLLEKSEVVLLACDGLYDVLTNKEAMIIIGTMLGKITDENKQLFDMDERQNIIYNATINYKNNKFAEGDELLKNLQEGFWLNMQSVEQIEKDDKLATIIAKVLTRTAYILGSTDNISAIVVLKEN